MKKILMMAVALLCLTACAQKQKGEQRGPRHGGGMEINKDSDSTFVALKNETLAKFKQFTFEDAQTGKTMAYNLMVPAGYDGTKNYPLVLFMADASTVGKDVTAPLTRAMEPWNLHRTETRRRIPRSCWCPNIRSGLCRMTGVRQTRWR